MVLIESRELRAETIQATIEICLQFAAQFQAPYGDFRLQRQFTHPIVWQAGISIDRQWVMQRPQPAGKLPLTLFDETRHVVRQLWPHRNKGRQRTVSASHSGKHRPEMGPLRAFVSVAR